MSNKFKPWKREKKKQKRCWFSKKQRHRPRQGQESEIPLPIMPENAHRVDEKYSNRDGYSDLERLTGTDFGNTEGDHE